MKKYANNKKGGKKAMKFELKYRTVLVPMAPIIVELYWISENGKKQP